MATTLLAGLLTPMILAAPPAPPSDLVAIDHPWDDGTRIILSWTISPDDDKPHEDAVDTDNISGYQVLTAVVEIAGQVIAKPTYKNVDFLTESVIEYVSDSDRVEYIVQDAQRLQKLSDIRKQYGDQIDVDALKATGHHEFLATYRYQIQAVSDDGLEKSDAATSNAIAPLRQWIDGKRIWFLLTAAVFCGAVIYYIKSARSGKPVKVRKIAGLEAVDEAVGRATEMGRSIMFIPGIQDMNDIQTIAGINILARVARTAAEYDATIEVPTSRSLVMTTARETVQGAFLEAGRPDAYNEDLIYYVTDEQFGFVAYLQGMMVREKPAACFYMGSFFAESLILAETGNSIGAIQIAGTAQPAQLPFFVAACDYTLIGEEFFAASAYLSGSPEELGSLKGQDVGKAIVAIGIVGGVGLLTLANLVGGAESGFGQFLIDIVDTLKRTVLT